MHSETKCSNIWLPAIAILAFCFMSTFNMLFYAIMLVAVPVIAAYIFFTNNISTSIYICVSAFVFSIVTKLPGSITVTENIVLTLLLLIPGVILGVCFKTKKDFKDTLIFNLSYDFALMLAVFAFWRFGYNINITGVIRDAVSGTFSQNIEIIKAVYPQFADVLLEYEHRIFEAMYVGLPGYIPFFGAMIFCFIFLLRYTLCRVFCMRCFVANDVFVGGLDTFRVGIVTNCCAIAMLFLTYVSETPLFTMICLNVLFIIMILYFIVGLAVLEHKLKQKIHYPGKRFFVILGIFVALFVVTIVFPVFNSIYIFLFIGFADSLFDFRKLNSKKGEV